jgi:hypothetical protein
MVDKIVKEVRDNIWDSWEHDRDNRRDMASDLAFLAGDQWPELVRQERESSGRLMLTINRLPQFVRQITNDIRQAELAIKASPVGEEDTDLCKIYDGILRQIHYRSSADHVYSMAAEQQVSCGIGAFRIVTDYVDDASFEQEIKVKPIRSPMSVYWDPASTEPDRSDANWVAIVDAMPRSAFEAKYPEASLTGIDVPSEGSEQSLFWSTDEIVKVVEYWRRKPVQKTIAMMQDGRVLNLDDIPKELRGMLPINSTRVVDSYKPEQHIISGVEKLEDSPEWIGKYIPIVACVGGEIPLEEKTYRYGAIRFARDAQQLYNFNRTASAESIALAPKAPYIVPAKSIEKYKAYWDTANKSNRPYLPYDPDSSNPNQRPYREAPPAIPTALMQESQIAADDMKATTGIYDAGLGARSNETSGRAIMARQQEGDVANFHFIDNLTRSLEHAGRIMIDLIPKIYDNERIVRLLSEDGQEQAVTINQVVMGMDGMPVMINDLSAARFDVRVSIGKAYTTKRIEAADSMVQFIQAFPQAAEVAGDLIAASFDWPKADELAKRLKAMVPPEILQAAENGGQMPPPEPPPPDPKLESEAQKNVAQARKYEAEAQQTELENQAFGGQAVPVMPDYPPPPEPTGPF